jgi:hypothetical protein
MVRTLVVCLLVALLIGCASTVPVPYSKTLEGVCQVWEKIRDKYPEIRQSAILLRELGGIDDGTWEAIVWVDEHAQELDGWLALVCAARSGEANAHVVARERSSVDWDQVGSAVLKTAAFALSKGLL